MTEKRVSGTVIGYAWRIGLCALATVVGTAAGGALISAWKMPVPETPGRAGEHIAGLLLFIASFALAAGLIPLARRLRGPYWLRWLMLAALCYVCLGVAAPLEGAIFTKLRGMGSIPVLFLPPCLLFFLAYQDDLRPGYHHKLSWPEPPAQVLAGWDQPRRKDQV